MLNPNKIGVVATIRTCQEIQCLDPVCGVLCQAVMAASSFMFKSSLGSRVPIKHYFNLYLGDTMISYLFLITLSFGELD